MSGTPLCDVVMTVQLGSTEEVGQHVVDSRAVLRADREVVAWNNDQQRACCSRPAAVRASR